MTPPPKVYLDGADAPSGCHRLRARDLDEARRLSARIPEEVRRTSTVLLDVAVLVDDTAREARRAWSATQPAGDPDTIRYIGTLSGLAGLIDDVCAVGIADGAVLTPLIDQPTRTLLISRFGQ
jgi:hypothetical protein